MYDRIKDWSMYAGFFDEVLSQENAFGISETQVKRWHFLLQEYLQQKPNNASITAFTIGIGLTKNVADEIVTNVDKLRASSKILRIVDDLYKNIDSLVIKT